MKVISESQSYRLRIIALMIMVIAIPLSNYLMSVSQFLLAGIWLLDEDLKAKYQRLKSNPVFWVLISLFLIHLPGLIHTSAFKYASQDLRVKLPLIILPILLGSYEPVKLKDIRKLFVIYVYALVVGSLYGFYRYFYVDWDDIRLIINFISHVRFSLNLVFGIVISIYLFNTSSQVIVRKIHWIVLIAWFAFFLFVLESVTGLFLLFFILWVFAFYRAIVAKKSVHKLILWIVILLIPVSIFTIVSGYMRSYFSLPDLNPSALPLKTANGNNYSHTWDTTTVENGHILTLFVCEKELKKAWEKRSRLNYDGADQIKQPLKKTLLRYLNSKGLTKDSAGVMSLTDHEIKAVEQGFANVIYCNKFSVKSRLYKVFFEYSCYKHTGQSRGYSVIQRIVLWKAALNVIGQNFLFGVGTGDVPDKFEQELKNMKSDLQDTSLRAHNQYLSIFIALGIFGFMWFMFVMIYPPFKLGLFKNWIFVSFFIIIMCSMLTEDTLETEAGVVFVAFFLSFFYFTARKLMEWEPEKR